MSDKSPKTIKHAKNTCRNQCFNVKRCRINTKNQKLQARLYTYFRDINKTIELQGGGKMNKKEQVTLDHLTRKIEQQEKTITQLVEIIAATNRRITDLSIRQKEQENGFLLS